MEAIFHIHPSILLVLMSAFCHAIYNAVLKTGEYKIALRAFISWIAAFLYFPLIFFVPFPSTNTFLILCLSAFVHFLYQLSQIQSSIHAELSVGYPIARGTAPFIIALMATLFLNEHLHIHSWIGIIIISISILLMTPFYDKQSFLKSQSKGILWSILTGIFIACYTITDAYGSRLEHNPWIYLAWFFLFNGIGMTIIFFIKNKKQLVKVLNIEKKRALIGGLLVSISYMGIILALSLVKNTAQIAALRETSIVFGAIIGIVIFKESLNIRKIIAILGIVFGCVMLKF
jgi:drug/metabolite transporter (DMT)-like permease